MRARSFRAAGNGLAHDVRMQRARTVFGKLVRLGVAGPLVHDHVQDLRNDIAGALHDNHVPNANVLTAHIVSIVQSGELDRDSAEPHRLEHRVRVHRSRPAHIDAYLFQPGRRNLTGKLERNRPARVATNRAQ